LRRKRHCEDWGFQKEDHEGFVGLKGQSWKVGNQACGDTRPNPNTQKKKKKEQVWPPPTTKKQRDTRHDYPHSQGGGGGGVPKGRLLSSGQKPNFKWEVGRGQLASDFLKSEGERTGGGANREGEDGGKGRECNVLSQQGKRKESRTFDI